MSSPRIKVMHVITRLVCGGAQRIVLDLVKAMDPSIFDVTLVAGTQTGDEGSLWEEADQAGMQVLPVPSLVREVSPLQDLRAFRALQYWMHENRPHVVHSHTSKAGFLGCLAASREAVPAIVLSLHGHILGDGAQIPGVPSNGWRRRLLATVARHGARRAHVVIAPNDHEREDGILNGMWDERRSITVPNGVDTGRFRPVDRSAARSQWSLPDQDGATVLGVVARLTAEKGVDIALRATARIPTAHLVVAGDGPERNRLRALARELGLESRVTFLGLVSSVESLLPAFDALLVPSRTEAHGMIAAEGLSCEVPTVASAVGGLKSLVLQERTGLLVPPEDPEALASSVVRLIARPDWAVGLAAEGRRWVEQNFAQEHMVESTEQVYRDLLTTRLPSRRSLALPQRI